VVEASFFMQPPASAVPKRVLPFYSKGEDKNDHGQVVA
jgi:hypothetical protein